MAKFTLDLSEYAKKTSSNMDTLVREVIMAVGERIVERSPVGNPSLWKNPASAPPEYVGGRFRGNWQYHFGTPPEGVLPDIDASGASSLNRLIAGVSASPAAGLHYIANNLPYAQRLEDGWSTQAPAGMVGLAIVDFQGIVRDEVARLSA